MTWARLDGTFRDHPKVVQAGPLAGYLFACSLSYAGGHMTDGFIPAAVVPTLTSFEGVAVAADTLLEAWEPVKVPDLVDRLVEVGLWDRVQSGFQIHDYTRWNPPKQQIEALQEAKKGARSRGGRARARTAPRNGQGQFAIDQQDVEGDVTGAVTSASTPSPVGPDAPIAVTSAGEPRPKPAGHTRSHQLDTSRAPARKRVRERSVEKSLDEPKPAVPSAQVSTDAEGEALEAVLALLEQQGVDGAVIHGLRRMAKARRSWAAMLLNPDEAAQIPELPPAGLVSAMGQATLSLEPASTSAPIRRPLLWLRTVAQSQESIA